MHRIIKYSGYTSVTGRGVVISDEVARVSIRHFDDGAGAGGFLDGRRGGGWRRVADK